MKLTIRCLVICAQFMYLFAAQSAFREGEACWIKYLQTKGKLDENFKSIGKPSPDCLFVRMPFTKKVMRKKFADRIDSEIPNHSDCLKARFDSQETLDLVIKISVVRDVDIKTALDAVRQELHEDLKGIMSHCDTNDESFLAIFNNYLRNNKTLPVLQEDYCVSKYVADNNIVDLTDVELNPHQIDIESLDCNQIVEKVRNDSENEYRITSLPHRQEILICVMDAYKINKVFDTSIALKVLYNLDVPKDVKEAEKVRLSEILNDFGLAAINCFKY